MAWQSVLQVHSLLLRIKLVLSFVLGRKRERKRLRNRVSFGELPLGNQHSKAECCHLTEVYWLYVFCGLFFLCALLPWQWVWFQRMHPLVRKEWVPLFWRNWALLSFAKTPWNCFSLFLSYMQNAKLWASSPEITSFFFLLPSPTWRIHTIKIGQFWSGLDNLWLFSRSCRLLTQVGLSEQLRTKILSRLHS